MERSVVRAAPRHAVPAAGGPVPAASDGTAPGGRLVAPLPWLPLAWVSVVLALLVAMDQVSRLAATVLDAQGNAWSLAELLGPSAWVSRAGWRADFGGDALRRSCLTAYVVLDLLLVAACLGAAVVRAHHRPGRPGQVLLGGVAVVGALVVVEDALALVAGHRRVVPVALGNGLARLGTLAGLLAALVVLALVWGWLTSTPGRTGARAARAYEAARQHRLSLIPVVVLGLLLVAPGADILDQVPDVVRRWGDGPRTFVVEGGLGVVALLVLTVALLLLGRVRTTLACRRLDPAEGGTPDPPADKLPTGGRPGLWLVAPAGVVVLAGLLALAGADVRWGRLVRFCGVPVLVWLASLGLRRLDRAWRDRRGRPLWRERPETTWTRAELGRLLVVGDVVALAVVALAGVGAVRAMTQVAVLQVFGLLPASPYAVATLVVAAAVVVGWWPLVGLAGQTATRPPGRLRSRPAWVRVVRWLTPVPGDRSPAMLTRLPAVVLGSSLVTFLALGTLPGLAARGGVLFVFVLCLTALTGLTAGASLVAGRYPTAEVFRAARLRSTPVVTLLLAAAVFAGGIDASSPIHVVRSVAPGPPTGPAGAAAARPDLPTTVRTWADAQLARGCARTVEVGGRPVGVLPMVLLASEGGGIRAAYWTVQATRPLADDDCAAHATVLSSGVSGGAVGLAVSRYAADPTAVITAVSGSRALGVGLVGLLVRDFAYAATGVPLPLLDGSGDPAGRDGPHASRVAFVDRAGLMEDVWGSAGPEQGGWRGRVLATGTDQGAVQPVVGPVVLNSMSVGNACRVWVSEVALRPPGDDVGRRGDGKIDCDDPGASGVRSVDLLSAYGAGAAAASTDPSDRSDPSGARCLGTLRVPTAALLAARFPYVTPSGRVGPCAHDGRTAPTDQLVDGGYLENTGLGTLADTSDVWLPAVQAWDAAHAGAADGTGRVVVAPVVVYLDNDTGNDQRAPQRDITSEALLPPLARLRAGSGAVADDATLQRATDAVAPSRVCGPDVVCREALASVPQRVFRVFPATRPQVAAPLGWILSAASRRAMDDAVAEQLATSCPPGETYVPRRPACQDGSGTLGDLRGLLARP